MIRRDDAGIASRRIYAGEMVTESYIYGALSVDLVENYFMAPSMLDPYRREMFHRILATYSKETAREKIRRIFKTHKSGADHLPKDKRDLEYAHLKAALDWAMEEVKHERDKQSSRTHRPDAERDE